MNPKVAKSNPFIQHLIKENDNKADDFSKASKALTKLEVYSDKKDVKDVVTNEVIFHDKQINSNYRFSKIFKKYIDSKGKLLEGHKVETKSYKRYDAFFNCFWLLFNDRIRYANGRLENC